MSDGKLTGQSRVDVVVYASVSGLGAPLGLLALQPEMPPVPTNASKGGRTLPLKLNLSCGGQPLTAVAPPVLAAVTRVGRATCPTAIDLETSATPEAGSQFRLVDDGAWIYNLDTKGLGLGLYPVAVQTPDNRRYQASIALRP